MACWLLDARPLYEPPMTCDQLDPQEHISMTFESNFRCCYSWKRIWKCLHVSTIVFRSQSVKIISDVQGIINNSDYYFFCQFSLALDNIRIRHQWGISSHNVENVNCFGHPLKRTPTTCNISVSWKHKICEYMFRYPTKKKSAHICLRHIPFWCLYDSFITVQSYDVHK